MQKHCSKGLTQPQPASQPARPHTQPASQPARPHTASQASPSRPVNVCPQLPPARGAYFISGLRRLHCEVISSNLISALQVEFVITSNQQGQALHTQMDCGSFVTPNKLPQRWAALYLRWGMSCLGVQGEAVCVCVCVWETGSQAATAVGKMFEISIFCSRGFLSLLSHKDHFLFWASSGRQRGLYSWVMLREEKSVRVGQTAVIRSRPWWPALTGNRDLTVRCVGGGKT